MTEDEMDGSTDSVDMSLSKLGEMVKGRGAWRATVHGVAETGTTEQSNNNMLIVFQMQIPRMPISQTHKYRFIKGDRSAVKHLQFSGLGIQSIKSLNQKYTGETLPPVVRHSPF